MLVDATKSTLTDKEREKLPAADFGDPDGRRFPILDQSDVDAAARLIGKADNPEAVKRRILAICRRKGLDPPAAWVEKKDLGGTLVTFGEVKHLGDGRMGGILVPFTDQTVPDLSPKRDYFTKETDFDLDDGAGRVTVYYAHSLDPGMGNRKLGPRAELKATDDGIWFEHQLNLADEHQARVLQLEAELKARGIQLGLSSGAPLHLVRRERVGDAHKVLSWPIAEASYTPRPAHPFARVTPLDIAAKSLGLEGVKDYPALYASGPFDDVEAGQTLAALSGLSERLWSYVVTLLSNDELPTPERQAALEQAFSEYGERAMSTIAALMASDDADDAASSVKFLFSGAGAYAGLTLDRHTEAVLTAVHGWQERMGNLKTLCAKEGRVLSKTNRERLTACQDHLTEVQGHVGALLAYSEKSAPAAKDEGAAAYADFLRLQIATCGSTA